MKKTTFLTDSHFLNSLPSFHIHTWSWLRGPSKRRKFITVPLSQILSLQPNVKSSLIMSMSRFNYKLSHALANLRNSFSLKACTPSERRQTEVDLDMDCLPLNPQQRGTCFQTPIPITWYPGHLRRHQSSQHNVFHLVSWWEMKGNVKRKRRKDLACGKRRAEPRISRSREKAELDGKKLSPLASNILAGVALECGQLEEYLTHSSGDSQEHGDSETV